MSGAWHAAGCAALCCLAALLPGMAAGEGTSADPIEPALSEVVFTEVAMAPDGRQLAFITRRDDTSQDAEEFTLWRLDPATNNAAPVRVTALLAPLSSLRWSPAGDLAYLASEAGGGAQLFAVGPAPAAPRRVTDPARFQDGVDLFDWLPDSSGFVVAAADAPDEAVLAALRARRSVYGDLRVLPRPSATSSLVRVPRSGGPAERLATAPFEELVALSVSPDGRWLAVLGNGRSQTAASSQVELLPLGGPPPDATPGRRRTAERTWKESFAWSGKDLFVAASGEEREGRYAFTEGRLFRLGPEDRLLPVAPQLEGYLKELVPLADGSLLVTANVSTRMRLSRIDPGSGAARLLREQRGWISNLAASRDGGRIAFVASDARHYPEIYLAQGLDGLAKALPATDFNRGLSRDRLPEIETAVWDDGAGGTVEGALFWPPGRRGEKGLPLVVDLHGGPYSVARTEAVSLGGSFLSYPALLAARGFLVLNPNSRGSAGRGDAFAEGINGHHCSRPAEDVVRGVERLVARGAADRERIGLIGYSGGGGLSKCLIGRSGLFRAVATGAGSWDDVAAFGSARGPLWAESFYRGKTPWEDHDLWWNESAIAGLGRIETPALILAGERDGVAPGQAEEMYHDLTARGVPAELLIFPGEGHIFTKPSHKRAKVRAEISWLEHWLLGTPRPGAAATGRP